MIEISENRSNIIASFGTPHYEQMFELRDAVLRRPFGRALTTEDRERDKERIHVAVLEGDRVIATASICYLADGQTQFRQVAVAEAGQKTGAGRQLMAYAEQIALNAGYTKALVHARNTAIEFYQRIGYVGEGDLFDENGIPHWLMRKRLG
ncbi:MAG: GNAT family N-acetyltransferase [Rickettsiales bacterium]